MTEWAAPFEAYRIEVHDGWLDYNGHMHDASYADALSDANEGLFKALDLSADYRENSHAALYTVEMHIRYLGECARGDIITARTTMVSADPKKIRLFTELVRNGDEVAATGEALYLHVDTDAGRTAPLSDERFARVHEVLAAHADLPRLEASSYRGLG